jgi:hypothetical protein
MNRALWILQSLLAALFVFAGVMKFVMSAEEMKGPVELSLGFLRFIGVCEILGGLGLLLPSLLRIRTGLTPLAALGLVIIMLGAVGIGLKVGDLAGAAIPFVVAVLLAFVAYGRWRLAPLAGSAQPAAVAAARRG